MTFQSTSMRLFFLIAFPLVVAFATKASAEETARPNATALNTTVLLQNEVSDQNGNGLAITKAVVFLSTNANGSGAIPRPITKNGVAISRSNPLASMDQADNLDVFSDSGFKWVRLQYRVDGNNRDIYTGACAITRGSPNGRDHYMQQVIIRPRSTDGRQTQFQPEDLRKPQSFSLAPVESETFEGTSDSGDVSEAIVIAANAALEANPTFVRWELENVRGERGGIIGAKKVTATIRVLDLDAATGDDWTAAENTKAAEQGATYAEPNGDQSEAYIKLKNATDDLQEVIITVSNWRHTQNWKVENGNSVKLNNLPAVGYGVAAFNSSHPRRIAIGSGKFQLRVPFEVTVSGAAGNYKLEINGLE